jgi:hypothetical protein
MNINMTYPLVNKDSGRNSGNRRAHKISRQIKMMISYVVTLCLLFGQILAINSTGFGNPSAAQNQLISIGIFSFQDESGANAPPEFGLKIAQELHRKLVQSYKDVLPRILNNASATPNTMTVEELARFGKQSGVKFIVRGGLLSVNRENAGGESKATIQFYADLIAVETASQTSARAEGSGAQSGNATNKASDISTININSPEFRNSAIGVALSSAVEQLATTIYQAMMSPQETPQTGNPVETTPVSDASASPQTDAAKSAEIDEELQQLIAQAEALVSNSAGASTDSLQAINQALQNLKNALNSKAQLLEQAKDTTPADQEILTRKQELQTAVSMATQQVSTSEATTGETTTGEPTSGESGAGESQPSGEKKNMLASISGYLGEAVGILQKIQEMRSLLRSGNEGYPSGQDPAFPGGDPNNSGFPNTPFEEPTTEVNGVVTESGSPVEGAIVTEPDSGATATTDSNGAYILKGVAAGRLAKLVIAKSGKQVGAGQIDLIRGRAAVADFDLKAKAGSLSSLRVIPSTVMVNALKSRRGNTGVLKGVVRDPQGKPLPRALVSLKGMAVARTDSQGQYTFINVPAGSHQLSIQKSGLVMKSQTVQVAAKKSNESLIQYAASERAPKEALKQSVIVRGAGATLSGKVSDHDKSPLAGVKITAMSASSAVSVLSNERGKFELRDLKQGQYRLLISKAGFDNNSQIVQLSQGKSESLDVQLKKSSSLTTAKIIEAQRQRREEVRRQPTPASRVPVVIRQPENLKGQLTGRIVDGQSGKPLSGVLILLQGQTAARTDNDGNYAIANLPQGSYKINVNKSGFAEQAKTTSVRGGNSTREDFSLRKETSRVESGNIRVQPPVQVRSGQLRGQIVDARTGRPLAGASIFIANRQAAATNPAGVFTVSDLQPGNFQVAVRMSGYLDAGGTVIIRSGEVATASFRLNPRAPAVRLRNNLIRP